jgi:hypothetical protein
MSKIVNITFEYFNDTNDTLEIYKNILSMSIVSFNSKNNIFSYLLDYEAIYYETKKNERIEDYLITLIKNSNKKSLTFTLILFKNIVTNHTLNATKSNIINISISFPKMVKNVFVPDFSYYVRKIYPLFDTGNIKSIEFSYG